MDPTLDYQSPLRCRSKTSRIASLLNTIASTLFVPSALLGTSALAIDPVNRHWLTNNQFNVMAEIFLVCNGVSVFTGLVACYFGSLWIWLAICLNVAALFLIPAVMYG